MSRLVDVYCVPPCSVSVVWPQVWHFIYGAMRRGGLSAYRPVAENVLDGRALLWIAYDGKKVQAAAVTEVQATEWRKVCIIVACGGENLCWPDLIQPLEQFARAEGCTAVRIMGRPGWERVLKEYRRKRVVLEKEIA
jgi:hypothetical protein